MNKIDLHIVWNSNSILLFQNTRRLLVLITEMWVFLLLAAYASAMECFTDAPTMNDLGDPAYSQDPEQFVAMKLAKTGRYVIEPAPTLDRFVFGTGESLELDGTSELEGPVELYDTAAGAAIHYRFNKDPQMEVVPSLDLSQLFEIIIEGSTISLIQNELVISTIGNYVRMSIRIGWRNGTICLDYFEDETEPVDDEPTDEPAATDPVENTFKNLFKFNFITSRDDL